MDINSRLAALAAAPKPFACLVTYRDGRVRRVPALSQGAAENCADRERANEAEGRLENIRAAFDIGTAREELSGSPFASARDMATNAALAFGGQGDPEAPICRFVDSAIRLHAEAVAAKAEARDATETSHRQAQAIRSLNAELAEAREALAEWHYYRLLD